MKAIWAPIFLSAILAVSCGAPDDQSDQPQSGDNPATGSPADSPSGENSIIEDSSLSTGAFDAGLTDALESLSDSAGYATGSGLALADNSKRTKSCVAADGIATVTMTNSVDREFSFDTPRRSYTRAVTGSGNLSRIWSQSDAEIGCDESGNYAAIDWRGDTTGLQLAVEFDRSRNASVSYENKIQGRSYSAERKFSAQGTRSVTWGEQTTDESGNLVRTKTVTSQVTRTHSRANSADVAKTLELVVQTKPEADLKITTVRDSETLALVSKTITSGTLVAEKSGDGFVEKTFENLQLNFADGCHIASGKVTASFYKSQADGAEAELVKSMTLEIADGEYTLTDNTTGEGVADFDLPSCATRDFQR